MNITTKYEIGDIVYAVHPCKAVCGGQVILNMELPGVESEKDQKQAHTDDIYIISPHEVRHITTLKDGLELEIRYELSNGIIRKENDIFVSFEDAARHAAGLYGKSYGKFKEADTRAESKDSGRTDILKQMLCQKLQHPLKAVLSVEQLERFEEEFTKATQGLVIKEA